MTLATKYSDAFYTLRNKASGQAPKIFSLDPQISAAVYWVLLNLSSSLERKILRYLATESKEKFINDFSFDLQLREDGALCLASVDEDLEFFDGKEEIFKFPSSCDFSVILEHFERLTKNYDSSLYFINRSKNDSKDDEEKNFTFEIGVIL